MAKTSKLKKKKKHTVGKTVEDMIARYPSLFQSRTQALHHLFVVLGCGYEWKDGQLVEVFSERKRDVIPRSAARILAKHRIALEHPYPYFDLCNLGTIPDNATKEWRLAADEARRGMDSAENKKRLAGKHNKRKPR